MLSTEELIRCATFQQGPSARPKIGLPREYKVSGHWSAPVLVLGKLKAAISLLNKPRPLLPGRETSANNKPPVWTCCF